MLTFGYIYSSSVFTVLQVQEYISCILMVDDDIMTPPPLTMTSTLTVVICMYGLASVIIAY